MTKKNPLLSLCIPTNGVKQWVMPVLDSIYTQNVEQDLFEVVITDDGDNKYFKEAIKDYISKYKNLHYYETDAKCFLNEIAAYKKAKGKLIKFVNHRNILLPGTVERFIQFAKDYEKEKPIVYFSNGALVGLGEKNEYRTFNEFVKRMANYSSWSSGMAIWKDDLKKMPIRLEEYNELFPHTTILFKERKRKKYIVDNTEFFNEIDCGKTPKGKYDFFYAFGVEYPSIILDLFRANDVDYETVKYVLDRNLEFIGKWYMLYVVFKKYTAHDITSANKIFGIYYSKTQMFFAIIRKTIWKINKEIRRKLGLKI